VHVLTKIFIVLVSLLAIMMVPLVVVYAQNEETFKSKYDQSQAQANVANTRLQAETSRNATAEGRLKTESELLLRDKRELTDQLAQKDVEIRRLESELVTARSMQAEIRTDIGVMAVTAQANQELTESLVEELRSLRERALSSERQIVELDEALRDVTSQLSVAIAARRALEEELQQVRDEHADAMSRISEFVAVHGDLPSGRANIGVYPDINLDATIISVRRNGDQILAEIDAGTRDGVKQGWTMIISQGGTFIGNLRIISVDINKATGVISHENAQQRGMVQVGHRATARKGRN